MGRHRRTKNRKQRVVMRSRRRSAVSKHLRTYLIRGAVLAGIAGFALGMATQSHSVFDGFIGRHTPTVEIHAAKDLAGLPLDQDVAAHHFGWWFAWARRHMAAQWCAKYPAIQSVNFQSNWRQNRVIILVAPRTPIVIFNGNGFDGEGVAFPMAPGTWTALPRASFTANAPKKLIGAWLNALCRQTAFWAQVASVSDDGHGMVTLQLQTGATILWGVPNVAPVSKKTDLLRTVLDDAHLHLGGASSADLRFFEDARIIVRPKSRGSF